MSNRQTCTPSEFRAELYLTKFLNCSSREFSVTSLVDQNSAYIQIITHKHNKTFLKNQGAAGGKRKEIFPFQNHWQLTTANTYCFEHLYKIKKNSQKNQLYLINIKQWYRSFSKIPPEMMRVSRHWILFLTKHFIAISILSCSVGACNVCF